MSNQAGARPAGWYEVGSGWVAYWNGAEWTGDRVRPEQLRPTPPPPTPAVRRRGRWDGTSKERLPILLAIGGVGVLVIVGAMVATALRAPLDRAERKVDDDCQVLRHDDDGLSFIVPFAKDLPCTLAMWDALEEVGFDSDDFYRLGGDVDQVDRDGYRLKVVDAGDDLQVTLLRLG